MGGICFQYGKKCQRKPKIVFVGYYKVSGKTSNQSLRFLRKKMVTTLIMEFQISNFFWRNNGERERILPWFLESGKKQGWNEERILEDEVYIGEEGLEEAIGSLKLGKYHGHDKITLQMLSFMGGKGIKNDTAFSEPDVEEKGNTSWPGAVELLKCGYLRVGTKECVVCGNHRGISLLSVP